MDDDIKEQLLSFLKDDYLKDYTEILGVTVGITEHYPSQADNQIRFQELEIGSNTENKKITSIPITHKDKKEIKMKKVITILLLALTFISSIV